MVSWGWGGMGEQGFWAEALPWRRFDVVHMNLVGTAGWGMGELQGRKVEWDMWAKSSNVLIEALVKLQKLTNPHPTLSCILQIRRETC